MLVVEVASAYSIIIMIGSPTALLKMTVMQQQKGNKL